MEETPEEKDMPEKLYEIPEMVPISFIDTQFFAIEHPPKERYFNCTEYDLNFF